MNKILIQTRKQLLVIWTKFKFCKYNIDIVKTVNVAKNHPAVKSSSVEELKSKKNSLTEKVKTHMREINNDELIGQDIHKMLKNALDKEMSGINNKFPDDSINKLKT